MAHPAGTNRTRQAILITGAILLTVLALLAIIAVSQPPAPPSPPALQVITAGLWAGWWLDDGWSVEEQGGLVGSAPAVPAWQISDAYLRYAFPPQESLPPAYRLRFNIDLMSGTLYLGVGAAWHPASGGDFDCAALVFPLQRRLSGQALMRRRCQIAGIETADGLQRPLLDVTQYDPPTDIMVIVQPERAQLAVRGRTVYDVTDAQMGSSGGLYLALGPQSRVRITNWLLEEMDQSADSMKLIWSFR